MRVKVPVKVVIETLNKRLADNKENQAKNGENETRYHAEMKKWTEDFVAQFSAVLKVNSVHYRTYNSAVQIDYELPQGVKIPDQPTREYEKTLAGWEVEEIENAIRILSITEDEYVSASTMKQIGKYI